MDDLCYLLKDVGGAGIFQLNCTLEDLHDSVKRSGLTLLEADLGAAHGKGEVLAKLARAIQAPDWFGHNWDALADALGDLSWIDAPGYVLLLHGGHPGGEELDNILGATVEFWRLHGKPFWVFFA